MLLGFKKYSGCGNDFIVIDDREGQISLQGVRQWVPQLCHRRQGIGADGVILWQHGTVSPHRMRIFNADGSEAEMCGNGVRCLAHHISTELGGLSSFEIDTLDGPVKIVCEKEGIRTAFPDPRDIQWGLHLTHIASKYPIDFLNTGVPHLVVQVDDIEEVDLASWAPPLRHHPDLEKGANVNIYQLDESSGVRYRTFERGVEAETLACGTGAAAVAVAAANRHGLNDPIAGQTRSGEMLQCAFEWSEKGVSCLSITGPAVRIFEGTMELVS